MNTDDKIRLAMLGDFGQKAAAVRFRAARHMTGLKQGELAARFGTRNTTVSNVEMGLQFPSRAALQYFFHEHRLDFNFMMGGFFAGLPSDVQERLFPALEVAHNEWDQKEHSG